MQEHLPLQNLSSVINKSFTKSTKQLKRMTLIHDNCINKKAKMIVSTNKYAANKLATNKLNQIIQLNEQYKSARCLSGIDKKNSRQIRSCDLHRSIYLQITNAVFSIFK